MNKISKILNSTDTKLSHRIGIADIRQAWGELDEVELVAIKNRADLVVQVQANYGLDKNQAQTRVDLWAHGREF